MNHLVLMKPFHWDQVHEGVWEQDVFCLSLLGCLVPLIMATLLS